MTPNLRINLLGEFRLLVDEQPLTSVITRRQQALLAYLLLHRHAPQPRQYMAYNFWPDSAEGQAQTNLRKLFFALRKVLPSAESFLFANSQSLGWRHDAPFTLDVADLESELDSLEQTTTPAVAAVQRAVTLYQGDLFPACYEEWLLPIRRALHERVVNTLMQANTGLEAQHEFQTALRAAEHLLRLDPLHEATYRQLMHLRMLSGDRAGALRVYHECVTRLEQELEVSPAGETQAHYQHLLKLDGETTPVLPPVTGQRHKHVPLVGRKQEWHLLQQAWQQMSSRRPQLLAIWGEAGMGKTRLVEELLHWARLRPGTVAYARAYAAEGALAYGPLTEWLRSVALRPLLTHLEEIWQTELARLVPELLTARPDLPPPTPMTEDWQRQRFHEALARAVLAGPSPRLLVLDDLQWCDAETLAWLRYLLRYNVQAPLLVVGTVRSEAVDEQHPLYELRQHVQREGRYTTLELAPLNLEETATLSGYLTDVDATGWVDQLYQETEGNPLFVVEMVRAGWIQVRVEPQDERQEGQAAPLPPTVQAVIAARLGQLSPSARQLTQVAAVIGRVFTHQVLTAAADMDEQPLVQGLDELWQRRIVREHGHGYDFSHDKIREVAYAAILPMQRRHIHHRVAQALEQLYAADLVRVWDQLAWHYACAHRPAQSASYLIQLSQQAEALDAYREASAYYTRALTLYEAHLSTELEGKFDVLFWHSALLERQGQSAQLAHAIETMLGLAQVMNNPERLAQAHLRQAGCLSVKGDVTGAIAAGERALLLYQTRQNSAGAIQALRELGMVCWTAGAYDKALRYSREVLQLHRQQGDVLGEATALHNLAEIYRSLQSPRQAIRLYEQALDLYAVRQDHRGQALTLYSLAYTLRQVAQPDQALHYYRQAQSFCERANDRLILSRVYHALAILHWEQHRPNDAIEAMGQAAEIARVIGHLPVMAHSLFAQGYMMAYLDNREMAQHLLHEALNILTKMEDEEGIREVQARLALLAAGRLDLPEPPSTMNWIRSHVILIEGKVYCEYELPTRPASKH